MAILKTFILASETDKPEYQEPHDGSDPFAASNSGAANWNPSTRDFTVTLFLIGICAVIYLFMVASGAGWMTPSIDSLLAWGANARSATVAEGEYWRLLTCLFEHIGILHLLVNMVSLYLVGKMLEPLIGKWRFLAAFLVTGIAGSIASIWWNPNVVSAGASGAIFGLFGMMLALLTTDLLPIHIRKNTLPNIGTIVVINLVTGFRPGVDYAAHIGGLIAGLLLGYLYYLFIKKSRNPVAPSVITATVLGIIVSVVTLRSMNDVRADYSRVMIKASEYETEGLKVYQIMEKAGDLKLIKTLNTETIPAWKKYREEIGKLDSLQLPPDLVNQRTLLKEYSDLRVKFFELLALEVKEDEGLNNFQLEQINQRLEEILKTFSGEKSEGKTEKGSE